MAIHICPAWVWECNCGNQNIVPFELDENEDVDIPKTLTCNICQETFETVLEGDGSENQDGFAAS